MDNIIALIPARSGSKGIPKKNIIHFKGIPLLAHSIIYAKKSLLIKDIIVSTDSEEFAIISNKFGGRTPFIRPKHLSGDTVEDYPVVNHAVNFLENEKKEKIDFIALLRPTSPLRPQNLIEKAYNLLKKNKLGTSVRSVVRVKEHCYRQWFKEGDKLLPFISNVYEPYNLPRQKLPVSFFQSGDIEFIRRNTLKNKSVSGNYVLPLVLNHKDLYDIDTLEDLNKKS